MCQSLFHFLTGIDVRETFPRQNPLTPESINHFYLKQGHIIEYYKVGPSQKRIIVFFWEEFEYVIPSHPFHSILEPLDEISKMTICYGGMIMALRRFPLFADCYRMMRWKYQEKVKARIYTLTHLEPKERLAELEEDQPWVFDLVPEEDIASYLRLNVGILKRLTQY